jgi:hypothetical protein
MSDRRIKTDDPGDPRVSAAYREIADECTPGHLDHTVLNAARAAAKPRWNRAVAWLRPAALAATIGVCLAIVVEISLLPNEEPAAIGDVPQEMAPSTAARPAAEVQSLEKSRSQAIRSQKLLQSQDPQRSAPAGPGGRADETGAPADAAFRSGEKAEDRARQPVIGDMKSPTVIPAAATASEPAPGTATERYCDESETGDPNRWLECILRLEREGLLEAARHERELLAEAFPPPKLP